MRGLSNLFRSRDPAELNVRPVGPGEIEPAIRLLLGGTGLPPDGMAAAAAEFEVVAAKRDIDLLSMQVAFMGENLLAAALPVEGGGGAAVLLMLSPAGASRQAAIAVASTAQACIAARRRVPALFQILLDPAEWRAAEELRARHFDDLATLLYLQRTVARVIPKPAVPPGIDILHDSPSNRPFFEQAVTGSYEKSLDCPKLHGRRAIGEVMAAHQATGEYDPALWFCLMEGAQPLGALLLSPVAGMGALELVYLGLAPAGRGKGLGDFAMQLALSQASLCPARQLLLAVDDQNAPALQLYYRHGLLQVHSRLAMMHAIAANPTEVNS